MKCLREDNRLVLTLTKSLQEVRGWRGGAEGGRGRREVAGKGPLGNPSGRAIETSPGTCGITSLRTSHGRVT